MIIGKKPKYLSPILQIAGINNWCPAQNFTVGASISTIPNLINQQNNLIQGTASSQAIAATSDSLTFTTTNKYAFTTNAELNNGDEVTFIMVLNPSSLATRQFIYWNRVGNLAGQWAVEIGPGQVANSISVTGPSVFICRSATNAITTGVPQIMTYVRTGNTHQFYVNNAPVTTTVTTARDFSANNTVKTCPDSFGGTFYEILSANRALNASELTIIHQDIANRRGISII